MKLEHRFYQKTVKEQTKIKVLIAIFAIMLFLFSLSLSILSGFYSFAIVSFAIILSVIAPFYDTPSLKKSGRLIYLSPLFLTEKEKDGVIKIHGGTLFDYVFVLDKKMSGKLRTLFIVQQYLQGLLNLVEAYESGYETNLKIKGTSYIINERTARKIGFEVIQTDSIQMLILILNYFNLLTSNSIAKGRLSFPNLKNIKTYETNLAELINRKTVISELNNKLVSAINSDCR